MDVMHPYRNSEVIPEVKGVQAFPPVYFKLKQTKGKQKMNCPKCGMKATLTSQIKGPTTLLGAGTGGYIAATASASTGAAIGSLVCPGIGTLIGGILGILSGAAGGAVAGNTVGRLIDENVFRIYCCDACGYQWRAA